MPSLPGALLQGPLLNAAFSSPSVMGVSRKSLHPSGKCLCPTSSIRAKHTSSTENRITFVSQERKLDLQNALVVCAILSFSVTLVIISDTHRFRN